MQPALISSQTNSGRCWNSSDPTDAITHCRRRWCRENHWGRVDSAWAAGQAWCPFHSHSLPLSTGNWTQMANWDETFWRTFRSSWRQDDSLLNQRDWLGRSLAQPVPESHHSLFLVWRGSSLLDKPWWQAETQEGSAGSGPTTRFDMVIVDEAHLIRNSDTYSHKAVRFFCDFAEAVVFLTATRYRWVVTTSSFCSMYFVPISLSTKRALSTWRSQIRS